MSRTNCKTCGSYEIRTFCVRCSELADHDAEVRAEAEAEIDELDAVCTARQLEIYKLQAEKEELTDALESLVALYDDDIGMGSFPAATQVECKSTTLDVIRKARAALAKVKGE
jgi:hypothetical protein